MLEFARLLPSGEGHWAPEDIFIGGPILQRGGPLYPGRRVDQQGRQFLAVD